MPSLMRQINVIGRCAGMYRTEQLQGTDLNAGHTGYILYLCRNPGVSQEKLAEHLCINRSNVARQLAHLEEHGYVSRTPSETDRRVLLVFPTEKAEAILPRVREIVHAWNDYLTDGMTDDELALLSTLCDRLSKRAREYFSEGVTD